MYFTVNDYQKELFEIACDCIDKSDNSNATVLINTDEFEFWLLINGKLEWELNYKETDGEKIPSKGTMYYEEYWSSDLEINVHIEQFLNYKISKSCE